MQGSFVSPNFGLHGQAVITTPVLVDPTATPPFVGAGTFAPWRVHTGTSRAGCGEFPF